MLPFFISHDLYYTVIISDIERDRHTQSGLLKHFFTFDLGSMVKKERCGNCVTLVGPTV